MASEPDALPGVAVTATIDPPADLVIPIEKSLDSRAIEVLALTAFRALFGQGIHIPLKVQDMVDMDVVVKDGDILLNLNNFKLEGPELTVWRIVFAFHGKPVLEYGRGIKNDLKIHYPQLCVLMFATWRESLNKRKLRARLKAGRSQELLNLSKANPREKEREGILL
jgi:hypothetical protein